MSERHGFKAVCECGESVLIETNDPYTFEDAIEVWKGWHEQGSFIAGKWHGVPQSAPPARPATREGTNANLSSTDRDGHAS